MRVAAVAALLLVCPARAAEPVECDAARHPWVRLEDARLPAAFGFDEIGRHLRAELERRGIGVCTVGTGEPVAQVQLGATGDSAVEVVVDVRDSVTRKRVSRTLDLRGIPRDARPLAIAIGTDELLTASWAEVALETPRETPAPQEITRAVIQRLREPERRASAGAALGYESYGGGTAFLGVDLRLGYRPFARVGFTARLGLRRGFDEAAPNGVVRASALSAGIGVRVFLLPPANVFGVDGLVRLDALSASFSADAREGALAHSESASAVVGSTGLGVRLSPLPALRLGVDALLGAPFRPVTATDSGSAVSAISGLAFATGVEVVLVF